MSDHADWNGLLQTIKATEASKVYVTHGFQAAFSRYLNEQGIEAAEVKTEFGTEEDEAALANEEKERNRDPNSTVGTDKTDDQG